MNHDAKDAVPPKDSTLKHTALKDESHGHRIPSSEPSTKDRLRKEQRVLFPSGLDECAFLDTASTERTIVEQLTLVGQDESSKNDSVARRAVFGYSVVAVVATVVGVVIIVLVGFFSRRKEASGVPHVSLNNTVRPLQNL